MPLAALSLALVVPGVALGQCPRTTLAEVEDEVMCPVCGTPLALATEAPQAQEQREFIIERVEGCQSKEEIKDALVAQFGESVLASPGGDGLDLLGYLLPAVAILAGAGGVTIVALTWRRRRLAAADTGSAAAATEPDGAEPSEADDARLDEDLRRYDL